MFVEFISVSKRFGDRLIIDDATFRVNGPELIGMVGPSGAGKSTVLAMIAGLETVDQGEIRTNRDGKSISISWIVQSSPLLTRRTVWDNVHLGGAAVGRLPSESSIANVLERLGIEHLATHRVLQLSGGERQRVAVARGLIARTDILLADEPTASLDAVSREAVTDALAEAAQTCLVIVATHDVHVAEGCDTVFEIDSGRVTRA